MLWEGFGKGETEQQSAQSRSVWYICALSPALRGLCQIPVLSVRELCLGGVLRSEHGGGSCAALCETANSAKLPALQHWLKYKCVCVREGEKNAWGDEKG